MVHDPTVRGQLIDGLAIAKEVRANATKEVKEMQENVDPKFLPCLIIIQVGSRLDSSAYVKMKLKAAKNAGVKCELRKFSEAMTQQELLSEIDSLNRDSTVHGILIQLPIPKHFNEHEITNAVAAEKDVDGFSSWNVGELAKKGGDPLALPCTPAGSMVLLEKMGVKVRGASVVVLGRSDIVGHPVAQLLRRADATVTVCHSRTLNLPDVVREADIVVAAIGIPEYVKGDWIKPGAVVIDVGINYVPDPTKKDGQKLVGDVDFEAVKVNASLITPVPGGVGPMTVAMLLQNVVTAAKRSYYKHAFKPLPLTLLSPPPTDVEISRAQTPKNVAKLADEMGLLEREFQPHGPHKGKVSLRVLDRLKDRQHGKYIVVTGITPTPQGEGKTTTTIGLAQALSAHLGKVAFANIRQPSMGPTFGVKGGASGGGYSQVIPMEEINLHLTGDMHAVSIATNLLAAAIDSRIFHEATVSSTLTLYNRLVPTDATGEREFTVPMLARLKKLGIHKTDPDSLSEVEVENFARLQIDPETITWKRVVDVNDRMLRGITIGQSSTEKGVCVRETGFSVTPASEIMAVLALSSSLADCRERIGKMVVANDINGRAVTCDDVGVAGALTALLKDTIKPNLVQTLEGTPVLVHAGPFGNISIGTSSIIADRIALKLSGTVEGQGQAGYVITEAGFDFAMGGERFFNIKCRTSGLIPDVVVVVATVRALKLHGGGPPVAVGQTLSKFYQKENVEMVVKGCCNLKAQIKAANTYGVPIVVVVNRFASDTDAEVAAIIQQALESGAKDAVCSDHWAKGGAGAIDFAKAVMKAADLGVPHFKFLYDTENTSIVEKLEIIARETYGAASVELSQEAQRKVATYARQGFGKLPICVAKTQYSLSPDPIVKGAPVGFTLHVRDITCSAGAGYLVAIAADMQTIHGLPIHPAFMDVEVNNYNIDGLF